MKLLVIIGTLSHMGGAERQALYLVEHLRKCPGCSVEVLAFEDGTALRPSLEALGVRARVFPYYFRWPRRKRWTALLRLAWLLRSGIRPDGLLPFVGVHSKTAALVWRYSGAKFCWWNQQDEGRDLSGTPLERRILDKLPCITSNSFAGRDFLSVTYDLDPGRILVYNNGTPLPDLARVQGTWRSRLGLQRRPIVTMVANVTAYKDHGTLLTAWQLVRRRLNASSPVLLLAGHLKEEKTVTGLKLKAFDLRLSSDDVRFLGPVQDVADLMLDSDLVVHSSLTEGCPNAVCEAMALGRAVVATDISGCRQALGPGGEPWLARPSDAEDLAEKLIRFVGDEGLRRNVGRANRERIQTEFSVEAMNQFFQAQIEKGLNCSLSFAGKK
jgi:glycosyltransferase involved in cell wall biosynthesis